MQIMQSQTVRTQLLMSNVARIQQGLGSEQLRVSNKNEHLPTHDFHIGQSIMYLNLVNRRWYPTTITSHAKDLEVTRSEQQMVSYIEKQKTTWNCTNKMKMKWTVVIHEH